MNNSDSLPASRIITICDTVGTEKDDDKRARMSEALQKKWNLSPEQLNAVYAHIKIRRQWAIDAIREILNGRSQTERGAQKAQETMKQKKIKGSTKVGGLLATQRQKKMQSKEILQLLKKADSDKDVLQAVTAAAEKNDTEALRALAAVYASKRPDIAVEALLHANAPADALAVVAEHQSKANQALNTSLLTKISKTL